MGQSSLIEPSTNEMAKNGKDELGRFVKGHKFAVGRPEGSPNKFTQLKRGLAEVFEKGDLKGMLSTFMSTANRKEQLEVFKIAVSLLPKEDKLRHEIAQVVINKTVSEASTQQGRCPKCSHCKDLAS